MKAGATYTMPHRRRRQQKTNFLKRLAAIKSKTDRLVVRGTNNNFIAELMKYETKGDKTVCCAHSQELKKIGYTGHCGNITAAYLTGYLCGKKALKEKASKAILDIGLESPIKGSRVFAALKGAIDAGMQINANESIFPGRERIEGKHLKNKIDFVKVLNEINKSFGVKA